MVMGILAFVFGSRLMMGPGPEPANASGATAGSSCVRAPGIRAPATASWTLPLMNSRRDRRDSFLAGAGGLGASVMQLNPLVLPLAEALLGDGHVVREEALVEENDVPQAEERASQPEGDDGLLVLEEVDLLEVDVEGELGDPRVVRRGVVGVV